MRIFGLIALLLVLVIAGGLLAPQFIDWNKYKGEIISQIEKNTGFQADISGDLDLAVLPMPRVVVNGLSVSNPTEDKPFMTLDYADVYLDIMPLLSGNISLKSITLNKPNIELRVAKDGSQNWMTETLSGGADSSEDATEAESSASSDIAIGSLSLKDGRVTYSDAGSGTTQEVKDINGTFSMQSLKGPFDVAASFNAMNMPLKVNAKTEAINSENNSISTNLTVGSNGAEIDFSGVIGFGEGFDAQGETIMTVGNLQSFLEKMTGAEQSSALNMAVKTKGIATLTQDALNYTNLVADFGDKTLKGTAGVKGLSSYPDKPLQITTDLSGAENLVLNTNTSLSADRVRMTDLRFGYKSTKANGTLSFAFPKENGKGALDANLTSSMINADELMKLAGQSASRSSSSSKGGIKQTAQSFDLPVNAIIKLSADKVIYDGNTIDNLKVDGSLNGSKLTLANLSISDYAGAAVTVSGNVANVADVSGISLDTSLKTSDLEATLKALGQEEAIKSLPAKIGAVNAQTKLSGHLDLLAFDTNLKALDATVTAKGIAKNIETSPTFNDMILGLKHPNLAALLQKIMPDSERNPTLAKAVDMTSQVSMDENIYKLTALNGSLGPISANGNITADMSAPKPFISGDLKLGKLPLETFMETTSSSTSTGGASNASGGKWSKDPIDTSFLNSANVDLKLSAAEITYGKWLFNNPSFGFVMKDGGMSVNDWKAGLFGGSSDVNLQMNAGQSISIGLGLNLSDVGLQSLVTALAGSPVVQSNGIADFKTDLKATGRSMYELINSLNGTGTINGTDITIRGINVADMARALGSSSSVGTQAKALFSSGIRGGSSEFKTLTGAFEVEKGVVDFSKLELNGDDAVVSTVGIVSLPAWTLDMKSSVQLVVNGTNEAGEPIEPPPPFEISYRGSLSNPGSSFAQNAIEGYLNKKISAKANKLIQDKLGDKLDGELGNVVGGLLGIKPKQAQQPVAEQPVEAAPANDNQDTQNSAPSPYTPESVKVQQQKEAEQEIEATPEPVPAEEPQAEPKKKDTEDVVKDLAKDVLKGFLQ